MHQKKALKSWRDCAEEYFTVEFPYPAFPSAAPINGFVLKIAVGETEAALKKIKLAKAGGPDDLATHLWKSTLRYPAKWLAKLFN